MEMMNRKLFLAGLLGCLLAMAPVRLVLDHAVLLETATSFAKNGNGGGNGNGNGGGNGNGNSGGNNGNGGSRGNGGSTGGGNAGAASDAPAASKPDDGAADAQALSVRHRNGFREQLTGGRYVMRDAQGRVVVDRRATRADRDRLKRLTIR